MVKVNIHSWFDPWLGQIMIFRTIIGDAVYRLSFVVTDPDQVADKMSEFTTRLLCDGIMCDG